MRVVIDTNVLMAGLLKDSVVRTVLLSRNISFFLPEHALSEIKKHENELLTKSGYHKGELKFLLNSLLQNIKVVPQKMIKNFMEKAELIMKDIDIKDSSFIATALVIKADGIWSYDNHFKEQNVIPVLDIKDLFPYL